MAYEAVGAIVAELERQQRRGFVEEKKAKGKGFSFFIVDQDEWYEFSMDIMTRRVKDKDFIRDLARIIGKGEVRYMDHTDHERMPLETFLRSYRGGPASYWGDENGFNYSDGRLYVQLSFDGADDVPIAEVRDVFSVVSSYSAQQAVQR